jgi:truncated hemoglobin YjbI
MTLAQAQRRIKKICREHRQHWLAVMHRQLDQTPENIVKDAIYAGRTE